MPQVRRPAADGSYVQTQTFAGGALVQVLRAAGGSVQQRVDRALAVLADELGTQIAYVGEFVDGQRVITHSVSTEGDPRLPVGTADPIPETLCGLVASGAVPALVSDTAADPVLAGHPHTVAFGVGAHAGVPLRVDGRVRGTVCCASTAPVRTWNDRDAATLQAVATYIGELLAGDEPPVEPDLRRLAAAVAAGDDLEALTRPLLQILQEVTGLDSTYLSLINQEADELVVAYACNVADLVMQEGLTVTWRDSPCRRSLDEGRQHVADVASTWPGAAINTELGITTFVSVPIRDSHDEVLGTLCGASRTVVPVDDHDLQVMQTFSQLLAAHLSREAAHYQQTARAAALEQRLSGLREAAERDPLTGLANRAGIRRWLQTAVDGLGSGTDQLAVAFIDLDHFKMINDTHGHATGDEILRRVAASLLRTGRAGDLHGRLGGDEFVVAALLPPVAGVQDWLERVRGAAAAAVGPVRATGSVGAIAVTGPNSTVDDLLHRADQAMYQVKQANRRRGSVSPA